VAIKNSQMNSQDSGLSNGRKIAIVTGASGNLGRAVIKKFISEGYFVIGTTLLNEHVADYPRNSFEGANVNLSNEDDSKEFVESVVLAYGRVDVAVLTVGGFAAGGITETKTSDIRRQYKLNFETAYNIAQPSFVQMLNQNNGRIFIIGSRPGLDARSGKGMIAYGLAKSLIFRLAELLNDEAKGQNVVTSIIVPSTIDTETNRKAIPNGDFNNWVKAEQIADVIYYYSTDAASALREPVIKVYNNA
jgi:NAD(P)-dependent dehydrogenase (short-subunit alcohol dehydrogenase family)